MSLKLSQLPHLYSRQVRDLTNPISTMNSLNSCCCFRFCGGTLRGAVTLALSKDVLISFQTTSPDSRITFNLRYTVYTDVCGAPSTISQWPVILQTNTSQPTICSTQLNVTHYDKIEILMKDSIGRFSCNFNGISVRTSNGSVLCQGINCLNSAGYDITNYTTLTVDRTSCVFSWYIQGKLIEHHSCFLK